MSNMTLDILPPPPRPLSSEVRARATTEPRVRGWWLAIIGIALVAAYFAYGQVNAWRKENQLLTVGVPVDAVVLSSFDNLSVAGTKVPPETTVNLTYEYEGVTHNVIGPLLGRVEPIVIKSTVPLRIDPKNPKLWTGRTQPSSLAAALVAAWTLAPLALLSLAGGLWTRRQLLSLYRDGQPSTASVVEVRHAALAPASQLVRCTLTDGGDNRVASVYLPSGHPSVSAGDEVPVIHKGPARMVAAGWFHR
ncbi:MAG TPA: hypothetical protein VGN72_22575 [Tepidisphaeraceae bacterium]|jgi:hypothetical protein|nr:hypothetical protein [Tepidisphaeraceae bacterium]